MGTYLASKKVDNAMVNLNLCDTSSRQEYERLRPLAYPQANVFLIVFSVVDRESLRNAVTKVHQSQLSGSVKSMTIGAVLR